MTIREEIIQAAQQAIAEAAQMPEQRARYKVHATAAFNAIVERMKEPSEAMLACGSMLSSAGYFADTASQAELMRNDDARDIWQAMLSALSEELL